jgi:hypothetical protein
MRLGLLLLVMLFAAPVQRVMAWGQEGHSMVAELAQRRLTPTAANELSRLLASLQKHDAKLTSDVAA